MDRIKTTTRHKASIKHQTHKNVFIRFGFILLIFISYFIFISTKYGYVDGFLLAWLSWSFFVLCTPIADAGMLIDFPIRLASGIRMVFAEVGVWVVAISLNIFAFTTQPELYDQTQLLHLLKHIIENPFPLWLIFIVSAIGTFLSIQLGDELLDVIHNKDIRKAGIHDLKIKLVYMAFVLILSFALYDFLLTQFDFNIPI